MGNEPIIARVFPRRTKASPTDPLAFFGPPGFFVPKVDEVHISVTFTWDIPRARRLEKDWQKIAPVKIGGPAFGKPSGKFEAGKYIKPGYTITSRGCPNHCWFCEVWKREPKLIELPIVDGWNLLDDNLLACSESHIRKVFTMLERQPEYPIFSGGLEAKLLKDWHLDLFAKVKPKEMFFAYDTPDDYRPLVVAAKKIFSAGFISKASNNVRCYILAGFKGDSIPKAQKRVDQVIKLGITPMVMVVRDKESGKRPPGNWGTFSRKFIRPALSSHYMK